MATILDGINARVSWAKPIGNFEAEERAIMTASDARRLLAIAKVVRGHLPETRAAFEEGEHVNSTVPFCRVIQRLEEVSRTLNEDNLAALDRAIEGSG